MAIGGQGRGRQTGPSGEPMDHQEWEWMVFPSESEPWAGHLKGAGFQR